ARRHGVPFYVAAPLSSVDLDCASGAQIPIEQRPGSELLQFGGKQIAPKGVDVFNPAFDVTPAELVTAIITEGGIASPPFSQSLAKLKSRQQIKHSALSPEKRPASRALSPQPEN